MRISRTFRLLSRLFAVAGPARRASAAAMLARGASALALAAVAAAFPPPAAAAGPVPWDAPGPSLDRIGVAMVARPDVGEFPAVTVVVGLDSSGLPRSVGEGVVVGRQGFRCFVLTTTAALGRAHRAKVRYANDFVADVRRIVAWDPEVGLAILEATGFHPPRKVPVEGYSVPDGPPIEVTVYGAPTWGLQVPPVRGTLAPPEPGRRPRRSRAAEAGTLRVEQEGVASWVLSGAPVLDPEGRLIGLAGLPRKGESAFGFVPVPPGFVSSVVKEDDETLEEALETFSREFEKERREREARGNRREKLPSLRPFTRRTRRAHPAEKDENPRLFGMGCYWIEERQLALRYLANKEALVEGDPRCLVAGGDLLLRTGGRLTWLRVGFGDGVGWLSVDALAMLEAAARKVPGDARVLGLLGFALLQEKGVENNAEAEAVFRRAVQLDPDNRVYLLDLGASLVILQRPSEAIPLLRRSIEMKPDDPNAWINLAIAWMELGSIDRALEMSETAARLAPDHSGVQVLRGILLIQAEKWHEAREVLDKALEHDRRPFTRLNHAIAVLLCGDAEQGRKELDEVFEEFGTAVPPGIAVVRRLLEAGKVAPAIRLLHRISLPGVRDAETWEAIATGAEQARAWDLAARAWAEVLERRPGSARAKARRGVALVFLHRYAEAEELLAPAVEQAPDEPRLVGFLALALVGQDRIDAARPLLERLDTLDPELARSVRAAMESRRRAREADQE